MKSIKYWYPVKTFKFSMQEPDNHFINIWAPEEIYCKNMKRIWHSNEADVKVRNFKNGVIALSEISGKIRTHTKMVVKQNSIEIIHVLTNLSKHPWKYTASCICVQLAEAPRFRYRNGTEVYYPGNGTFYTFKKEYRQVKRWNCQFLCRDSRKKMLYPLILVPDRDEGEYVIAHAFQYARTIEGNGNHRMHCIHSEPYFGDIAPGETKEARGIVFVVKGSLQDALSFYLDWKGSLNWDNPVY